MRTRAVQTYDRCDSHPVFMNLAPSFARDFPDGIYPPNTLVIVTALVHPELVVEVEAMAVKPPRASAPAKRPDAKRPVARQVRRRARR